MSRYKWVKWLYPGMGVKRWLSLVPVGAVFLVLGMMFLIPPLFLLISETASMAVGQMPNGISNWLAGIFFTVLGLAVLGYGLWKGLSSILGELSQDDGSSVVELIYAKRYLQRGPKIVVIGGGTGLSTLLKGLKEYTSNITAIVTVTDDGGSSGRLRGDLGVLPPGDIRNCLVALADKESLMERVLQYRFSEGELSGHNLGNLLIVGLSQICDGFYSGVQELSKVLAVRGQVLPSTLEDVSLGAVLSDGSTVRGECCVSSSERKIRRVFLEPAECRPLPEALWAIREADAVILGPGSLYTSVIPNLLVKGVAEAINNSSALKVYVCNVMTQPGETRNYSASDHLKAIIDHCGRLVDYVMVNTGGIPERLIGRYRREGAAPVGADIRKLERMGVKPVKENLVLESDVVRHHPQKLARALLKLIFASKTPAERERFMQQYMQSNGTKDNN
ncbi:gluconeogenesis factor YvcK family protein [Desulfofalx alkaliphila]|uniref:gluconeogenesis factor YvcK family protein n=1 Tax=Desulfofalx alkaliphila TaxID=105483 RepID=UPI000AF38080|nr:gluconeogenesis factor YvcK family protein [Desulfofalx alkaliphila]